MSGPCDSSLNKFREIVKALDEKDYHIPRKVTDSVKGLGDIFENLYAKREPVQEPIS